MNKPLKIVITGGHHSSALPVIKILREKYPDIKIVWFGHKYTLKDDKNPTMEYREISSMNMEFIEIKAGKFYRTFNLKRLLKIPYGFFQSLILLRKVRPDAVMSFGGYLAVPVVMAAKLLDIPSITHEQTFVAGYANKLISKYADKVLVSWPQSMSEFNSDKVVYTGLPLRESIYKINSNSFDTDNGLPTIYITAGKTGSHKINSAVLKELFKLLTVCNIIHQCGDYSELNDYDELTKAYDVIKDTVKGKYYVRKFVMEDEIGEVFSKSNLIVSRAGAHVSAEIYSLQKPALLIPIPLSSHNEQNLNAKFLVDCGLGKILEEKELHNGKLAENILEMLNSLNKYKLNSDSGYPTLKKDAAELIAGELLNVIKK